MQGKRWCFTLNNYADSDLNRLGELGSGILAGNALVYLVYGREQGPDNGTPHLQGYAVFRSNHRLTGVKSVLGERGHYEISRGTPVQASEYCKKDGDFNEFGTLPGRVGRPKSPDVSDFCNWVRGRDVLEITEQSIAVNFPSLWLRYGNRLLSLSGHLHTSPVLENRELRPWQLDLERRLLESADDRTIQFFVDDEGGKGKSFFIRWMFSKYPEKVQMIGVGKRDDIAHCIDKSNSIFLFNVPREGMEYLSYKLLEEIKDRMVFVGKYQSHMKLMQKPCHVIVFWNGEPDMNKLTADRYESSRI